MGFIVRLHLLFTSALVLVGQKKKMGKVHACISQKATATNANERRRDSSLTASVVLQLKEKLPKILPSTFYFATDILL